MVVIMRRRPAKKEQGPAQPAPGQANPRNMFVTVAKAEASSESEGFSVNKSQSWSEGFEPRDRSVRFAPEDLKPDGKNVRHLPPVPTAQTLRWTQRLNPLVFERSFSMCRNSSERVTSGDLEAHATEDRIWDSENQPSGSRARRPQSSEAMQRRVSLESAPHTTKKEDKQGPICQRRGSQESGVDALTAQHKEKSVQRARPCGIFGRGGCRQHEPASGGRGLSWASRFSGGVASQRKLGQSCS